MNKKDNISQTVTADLCNSCGACYAVCPVDAIEFYETLAGHYFPCVDDDKCIDCGQCSQVCPGDHFGESLMKSLPEEPFKGKEKSSWIGKALNGKIFENAQSGGIVTALLAESLKKEIIKSAVIVTMETGNPPRAVVRLAKNEHELMQAQKSKYAPVPLLAFLKELKDEDFPIALAGVSCQIHGLKNILDKVPGLNDKIAFTVGLICDRVMTYAAVDYLVSDLNTSNEYQLYYRDKKVSGYPGDVHVVAQNGNTFVKPAKERMKIKDFFTPARCRICFDKINVFSDITIGDPNGIEGFDRENGESVVIVRSEKGQRIMEKAIDGNAVNIRPLNYERILKGQKIDQKKHYWNGYIRAWAKRNKKLPNYCEFVKNNNPGKTKKYELSLHYSLELDNYSSRDDLLTSVEAALKKHNKWNWSKIPVKVIRKLKHKFKS
ncbi:MAG: Coenzyme F420 hydrogenase/dehydrogenase, beta subunit C-terminal domain [Bacteroidales bacterium]